MYKTEIQPSQSALYSLIEGFKTTNTNLAIIGRTFIKKESTYEATFLIFWNFYGDCLVQRTNKILFQVVKIKMSTMEALKDLQ